MFDRLIFSPDPRTDQDSESGSIDIYLHSNGGDGSVAALLERNEKGHYELWLYDQCMKSHNDLKKFDTYNVKTICNNIERWFKEGHLQPHLIEEVEGEEYYVLISKKSSEN